MLVKAKNKVNGSITLVPERYLKFNKNYKKATKTDLKQTEPTPEQETVATEEQDNG